LLCRQSKKYYILINHLVLNKTLNFKANPSLAILDVFSRLGSGFDVVSGGEIARCLEAGVDPSKIVYSGCGNHCR
jgi:diaminopimelate decarboxylase